MSWPYKRPYVNLSDYLFDSADQLDAYQSPPLMATGGTIPT
jgi:hypothetical protein